MNELVNMKTPVFPILSVLHFQHQMCAFPLPRNCDTSWVSYSLIQFWDHIPRVSVRSLRLWAQSHKTALASDPNLTFNASGASYQLTMNERSAHLPSLCSIIARWAYRIQENSLLTVYAFIIKGYNSRTVRWKRHTGKVWGRTWNFMGSGRPTLLAPPYVPRRGSLPPQLGFSMEASLCRHDG